MNIHVASALFLLLGSGLSAPSQNLIPDSSFSRSLNRTTNPCWNSIGHGSIIYVSDSTVKDSSALEAHWLKEARACESSRSDFMHIRLLDFPSPLSTQFYSDIAYCKLTESLTKDSIYHIEMWVLPPDFLSVTSVQVYLSEDLLKSPEKIKNTHRVDLYKKDKSALINNVSSVKKTGKMQRETHYSGWEISFDDKWICISADYKASGGEHYLYIANLNSFRYTAYTFSTKKHKLTPIKNNNPQNCPGDAFEFFIDDVSVRRVNPSAADH